MISRPRTSPQTRGHSSEPYAVTRALTIIELLVVISIVAVVISITLPAIASARNSARRTLCLNNLRQIGLAASMYTDQNGRFPIAEVLADINRGSVAQLRAFAGYADGGPVPPEFLCPNRVGDWHPYGGPGRSSFFFNPGEFMQNPITLDRLRTPTSDAEAIGSPSEILRLYEQQVEPSHGTPMAVFMDSDQVHLTLRQTLAGSSSGMGIPYMGRNGSFLDGSARALTDPVRRGVTSRK